MSTVTAPPAADPFDLPDLYEQGMTEALADAATEPLAVTAGRARWVTTAANPLWAEGYRDGLLIGHAFRETCRCGEQH
ncbi:hypothetical protein [Streptomyces sp. AC1-42T]|uniref:hypothetical protein n=1 Tax=Streptomyces sp. AC1-42T TaxID=2218665 RepID=UPI000DAD4A8E|nr:hypothetical protein [Streptomyces sp. AC1-42T]PZT71428.1 hypothetical protein DNK55_32460 [Streptomyces sp. AC1-42T]